MVEYAAICDGPPSDSLPWPAFMAVVKRVEMFEARARLRFLDSVAAGIAAAFGGESGARDELVRLAFPNQPDRARRVLNLDREPERPVDG